METAFYVYTIAVMLVSVVAGAMALAAYFVSRKRAHAYAVVFFFSYFLDLALVFQNEYLSQNTVFEMGAFYTVQAPLFKIVLSACSLASLWLIVCDCFGRKNVVFLVAPVVGYLLVESFIVLFGGSSPATQFFFYEMRQIFLLWIGIYAVWRYFRIESDAERLRLKRYAPMVAATMCLVVIITLEDVFMILVLKPDDMGDLLPLYLSERNFSENIMLFFFAFVSLKASAQMLQLRFVEPPIADTEVRRRHIDDLLPSYCVRHGLTSREREVLTLILDGKDNQNIANDLHLALGTVKAHTHNILKKTDSSNRQQLIQDFWKE